MIDSEFTCEVVKIIALDPIPGADKVEVAKFVFADGNIPDYQCVVGKGQFTIGATAIYISDDSLVPVSRAEFEFLKDRLDYKGTPYYRIRAAKIRGVVSTGMLLSVDSSKYPRGLSLGTEMQNVLGVTKYESPAEKAAVERFVPEGKGLLFKFRKWLNKKLYKPVNVPTYSVVSLRKVPTYFEKDEPVYFTEKIHGSNIRFGKVNGKIYIGSHHVEKSDSRGWLLRKLFPGKKNKPGFYGTDVWSAWFYRKFPTSNHWDQLPNNVVFYGELYGPGIQPNYDYGLQYTDVKVFDAYDVKAKRWLSHLETNLLLPGSINLVDIGRPLQFNVELLRAEAEANSTVGAPGRTNNIREGIVVRSVDWNKAGKHVSSRYLTSKH